MANSGKSSRNEFEAGPWKILITRSHILKSKCERGRADGCQQDAKDICDVCKSVAHRSKDVWLGHGSENHLLRQLGGPEGNLVLLGVNIKLFNINT